MRLAHGRFHLTYCTNIHPAEDWRSTFANLADYCVPLKARLSPQAPFGIGLRLSNRAAVELLEGERLRRFRDWLDEQGLYVFTLNGFPYGAFHHTSVKDRVYAPDWQADARVDYTDRLARVLAVLLPQGMDGGISTLPLTYQAWLQADAQRTEAACRHSALNLAETAARLARIRSETGTCLHLDLEPEPDCLLEDSAQVIRFYNDWLLPVGGARLAERLGCAPQAAERVLREHVRVCVDTCHFAVVHEPPEQALARLAAEGIGIGKVQLSAALKVALPAQAEPRRAVARRLQAFAESTYLHQVVARCADGSLRRYADLETALPELPADGSTEWRVHFHVPVFMDGFDGLGSTQAELAQALRYLSAHPVCAHLEIETYTWSVLPEAARAGLLDSIEREYDWVTGRLDALAAPAQRRAAGHY